MRKMGKEKLCIHIHRICGFFLFLFEIVTSRTVDPSLTGLIHADEYDFGEKSEAKKMK